MCGVLAQAERALVDAARRVVTTTGDAREAAIGALRYELERAGHMLPSPHDGEGGRGEGDPTA